MDELINELPKLNNKQNRFSYFFTITANNNSKNKIKAKKDLLQFYNGNDKKYGKEMESRMKACYEKFYLYDLINLLEQVSYHKMAEYKIEEFNGYTRKVLLVLQTYSNFCFYKI